MEIKRLTKAILLTSGILYGVFSFCAGLSTLIVYGGLKRFYKNSLHTKFELITGTIGIVLNCLFILIIFCAICYFIYESLSKKKKNKSKLNSEKE